jgi:hypothetical protein
MRYVLLLLAVCACSGPARVGSRVATSERDAVLRPGEAAIGGIVRDAADGQPLSMVSVQADQDGKRIAHDISDYQGRYRLGPLPPGHYDVSAKFANARVQYEGIVVEKEQETDVRINIDLRDHRDKSAVVKTGGTYGSIQGVVLDGPGGNPFPGTVVSLSADHLVDVVMAITDAEGGFHFRGLRPGRYALSSFYTLVEQGNIEVKRGNIIVNPGETTSVQLILDLRIR